MPTIIRYSSSLIFFFWRCFLLLLLLLLLFLLLLFISLDIYNGWDLPFKLVGYSHLFYLTPLL